MSFGVRPKVAYSGQPPHWFSTTDRASSPWTNNCRGSEYFRSNAPSEQWAFVFLDNGLSDKWAFSPMGHFCIPPITTGVFWRMGRKNNGMAPLSRGAAAGRQCPSTHPTLFAIGFDLVLLLFLIPVLLPSLSFGHSCSSFSAAWLNVSVRSVS